MKKLENIIQFKNVKQKTNMENLIWDAVPAQRTKKVEKYNFAVITMSAIEKLGAGRKFSFNKAAQELLSIVGKDRVSFGFTPDGEHIYIRKAAANSGFELTQTCSISDKKTFEFIAKRLDLNTEVENEFSLAETTIAPGVFELVLMHTISTPAMPEITTFELGEISDEEEDAADLSSIPVTPEGGAMYEEAVMPEPQDEQQGEDADNDIMGVTFDTEEVTEESVTLPESADTEEDVW